jgi:hypothetical protein
VLADSIVSYRIGPRLELRHEGSLLPFRDASNESSYVAAALEAANQHPVTASKRTKSSLLELQSDLPPARRPSLLYYTSGM